MLIVNAVASQSSWWGRGTHETARAEPPVTSWILTLESIGAPVVYAHVNGRVLVSAAAQSPRINTNDSEPTAQSTGLFTVPPP